MSEGCYALGALLSLLASIAGIWNAIRRRQLERKILDSLTDEQRRAIGLKPKE